VRGVAWDRAADPRPIVRRIASYARVLCLLRGTISVWRENAGDEETYNFSTPLIEQPHRALSLLYALARGHALVHGRRNLAAADLPLVARAALESTPNDRRAVMRILLANGGTTTTTDVERTFRCSAPTARAILETLEKLGIGTFHNSGPPVTGMLVLDQRLRWLLTCPIARSLARRSLKEKNPRVCVPTPDSAASATDPMEESGDTHTQGRISFNEDPALARARAHEGEIREETAAANGRPDYTSVDWDERLQEFVPRPPS